MTSKPINPSQWLPAADQVWLAPAHRPFACDLQKMLRMISCQPRFFLFSQPSHNICNPDRGKTDVLQKLLSGIRIHPAIKPGNNIFIHMLLTKVPQALNNHSAYSACCCPIQWRGPPQDDLFFTDLYGTRTTIRKINDLHGNLCGKSQKISCIGP